MKAVTYRVLYKIKGFPKTYTWLEYVFGDNPHPTLDELRNKVAELHGPRFSTSIVSCTLEQGIGEYP